MIWKFQMKTTDMYLLLKIIIPGLLSHNLRHCGHYQEKEFGFVSSRIQYRYDVLRNHPGIILKTGNLSAIWQNNVLPLNCSFQT